MASAVKRYTGTASTIMESSYSTKQTTLKVRRPRDKNYQKIMHKKRSNNLTKKQRQSYQKNKTYCQTPLKVRTKSQGINQFRWMMTYT